MRHPRRAAPKGFERYYRRPDPGGGLYAISAEGMFIKFGVAADPATRLTELQVGSPLELRLLASIILPDQQSAFALEKVMHVAASRFYVRGEWFRSCPRTLAIVEFMKRDVAEFERCIHQMAAVELHQAKTHGEIPFRSCALAEIVG